MSEFRSIKACVFDAYGTLFDVHSAVAQYRAELGDKADPVSALWRSKQLEYTWLRSLMGRYADFWQVTGAALDYALASFDINNNQLRDNLLNAYLALDCYPEVPSVLQTLQEAGLRLIVLSNGSPKMLKAVAHSAGIDSLLEANLSVDSIKIYKPDPRVYRMAVEYLQLRPEQISFQSSNSWDTVGAASFGFKVAWINRFNQRREQLPNQPQAELKTLSELPDLLGL